MIDHIAEMRELRGKVKSGDSYIQIPARYATTLCDEIERLRGLLEEIADIIALHPDDWEKHDDWLIRYKAAKESQ